MIAQQVTIIVLNWQQKDKTLRCLQSLERLAPSCHIIVVDNGSEDDSVAAISEQFAEVELIALPTNVGFAAGCNIAIRKTLDRGSCDYIFLVNNDAAVHPNTLSGLLESARSYPAGAILGPKVYYWQDRQKIWYAGARRRRGVLAATDTGRGEIDTGQFSQRREVDYIFGAAMLIHRRVFEKVGLFDERFFVYLEDLDFCIRAQANGFPIVFVPEAHVWHEGSASTSHDSSLRRSYLLESTAVFLKKHASPVTILPIVIYWSLLFCMSTAYDMLRGDSLSIVRSVRSVYSGLVQQDSATNK